MPEEQKKFDPVQLMAPVTPSTEIQNVRVLQASMGMGEKVIFPLRVESRVETNSHIDRDSNTVFGIISFKMLAFHIDKDSDEKATESLPESDASIELNCKYQLIFQVNSISDFSDTQLNAFGCVNGLYNAWPYWREYVQSSIARMGLPPFIVPVLTVDELQGMEETAEGTFSLKADADEAESGGNAAK